MGLPIVYYSTSTIVYSLLGTIVPHMGSIHPIAITMCCIVFKCLTIITMTCRLTETSARSEYISPFLACFAIMETLLDHLDGQVARYHNKCTTLGHHMDKYSDVCYRVAMIVILSAIAWIDPYTWHNAVALIITWTCASLYLCDICRGRVDHRMEINGRCISKYVEDNSILISFVLPLLL